MSLEEQQEELESDRIMMDCLLLCVGILIGASIALIGVSLGTGIF